MKSGRAFILRSSDVHAAWNFVTGEAIAHVEAEVPDRARAADAAGNVTHEWCDPFAALDWMSDYDLSTMPDARWVGFFSYEFCRSIETLPATTDDDLGAPLFAFGLYRAGTSEPGPGQARPSVTPARITARSFSPVQYRSAVQHAIDYIAAGDVFQVNLAQRFSVETPFSNDEIWSRLIERSPSQYGAAMSAGDVALISNSPELFFRIEPLPDGTRRIVNRPIKGTRPNAPGMFDELAHSAKDRAELAMIVDLQRNDLGRVCTIGSVVVREPRVIEQTPTVNHGVATIDGTLRDDVRFSDVVRALFPCGSITGCPKIRAMQIIDELEPVARGPYCGAIGYLAADGSAEFNVAIRTMTIKNGIAQVYVGGGIVADSTPQAEYDETIVKARAMFDALGVGQID